MRASNLADKASTFASKDMIAAVRQEEDAQDELLNNEKHRGVGCMSVVGFEKELGEGKVYN